MAARRTPSRATCAIPHTARTPFSRNAPTTVRPVIADDVVTPLTAPVFLAVLQRFSTTQVTNGAPIRKPHHSQLHHKAQLTTTDEPTTTNPNADHGELHTSHTSPTTCERAGKSRRQARPTGVQGGEAPLAWERGGRAPQRTQKASALNEHPLAWARGELNPHVLSDTRT
jgi:hypothetical protein